MKKVLIVLGAAILSITGLSVTSASAGSENAAPKGKVTICHATGSETNPYVRINVSVNALKNAGHGTVNLELALETIGTLNPGFDLAAFVDIGGHTGDIFLIDQENNVPCPTGTDTEDDLVSATVCLEAEVLNIGPSFQADVDAEVARLVGLGATVGECPVVEETTTTTVVEETPVEETPVTPEAPVVVPVVESTPVAPVSAPVALPHTV